jgi:RNA polymerase sigma-70 factor (ECF subfamily)
MGTSDVGLVEAQQWLVDLFECNADAVFNLAYRVTSNTADAEDVVQESFVRAFLRREDLRDRTRARPWLLSIAFRQSLMLLRARRDVPTDPVSLESRADQGTDPVDAALRKERAVLVRQAIGRLTDDLRAAVVLRDVEGLQLRDVAEILGIGLSATKMRIARAREQLRTELEGVL